MSIVLLVVGCWFGVGLLLAPVSYGVVFAHFQREFPTIAADQRKSDSLFALWFAAVTVIMPPVVLVALVRGKHGMAFK